MRSLPLRLTARAWDCGSAAPLLSRMAAVCGPPTIPHAAQDFVSHYPRKQRHATQLCREIALDRKTTFRLPTTLWFECIRRSIRTIEVIGGLGSRLCA